LSKPTLISFSQALLYAWKTTIKGEMAKVENRGSLNEIKPYDLYFMDVNQFNRFCLSNCFLDEL
jgi:hypothetical protein